MFLLGFVRSSLGASICKLDRSSNEEYEFKIKTMNLNLRFDSEVLD